MNFCRCLLLSIAFLFIHSLMDGLLPAQTVRVATCNVENYLVSDRRVDGIYRRAYPKPESSKEALRRLLHSVNADVIALQEMGTEAFLIEFQRDLAKEGLTYPYRAWMQGTDTVRHLAVLSRLPIAEVIRHDDIVFTYFGEPIAMRRGMLEVVFAHPEGDWRLYNLHLKSRWTERRDDPRAEEKRVGEATAARERIRRRLKEDPHSRLLVVGDFNDTAGSRAIHRFRVINRVPFLHPIPAFDSQGHSWTHFFQREEVYSRVDYIFASPSMYPLLVGGQGHICDLSEWNEASDHRIVWADFSFDGTAADEFPAHE